jgi:hypothetical protein
MNEDVEKYKQNLRNRFSKEFSKFWAAIIDEDGNLIYPVGDQNENPVKEKTVTIFEQLNDGQLIDVLDVVKCNHTCITCKNKQVFVVDHPDETKREGIDCEIHRNISPTTFCKNYIRE